MKNIKILTLIFLIIFAAGCKKFLDVNVDPNNPGESSVEFVFPAGVENTSQVFGGYWLNLGEIWSQHWTSAANAPQYQAEDSYSITAGDYSYDLSGWEMLYTRALTDYEWVKEDAAADSNWTYYLMAETMQCYTYHVLADFFDQIPLKEALNKVPANFDNGESVYIELVKRLDFALNQDLSLGDKPGESDIVFDGNMNDWEAFANTLKLKIFLRQRFVNPVRADSGISALYNEGAQFLDKDAGFDDFADESGRDNYMYSLEFRGGNINMKASKTILDFLIEKDDSRLDTLFEAPASGHAGMYQGDFRNEYSEIENKNLLSSPYVFAKQPVYFISKVESYFLQAEACMIGLGTGDDKVLYEDAILEHFNRVGAEFGEDTIFEAGQYAAYPSGTDEEKLEAIIVQKWISMTNTQGMESFFEHNRTGYPRESSVHPSEDNFDTDYTEGEFTVSVTSVLSPPIPYPKRLMFPSSEQSRNPNVPAIESLNVPVWWDVRDYQSVYTSK